MKTFFIILKACFVIALILVAVAANAEEPSEQIEASGTLIVTYQTGSRAERLDRVRFLIKDDENQQQMYPKSGSYVHDENSQHRMVVIEDLPRGEFSLEFVLPNHDQLFDDVQIRKFTITKDEVVKIDQVIKVRYATVLASAEPAPDAPPFSTLPWITIMDDSLQLPSYSAENKLTATNFSSGSYTIVFQDLPGYHTPESVKVQITPGQIAGPFIGEYTVAK